MDFPVALPPDMRTLAAELKIKPEDIEEHFTKGGGPGGQKINKTSSCVELTHLPTKTTVRVQSHRAQSRNRMSAYKRLIYKIEEDVRGKASKHAQELFRKRKQKLRRSRRAKEKMLEEKHRTSEKKEQRKPLI